MDLPLRLDHLAFCKGRDPPTNFKHLDFFNKHLYFPLENDFSNFSYMFLNPNIFSNLDYNCSNLLDMRNLQEQVKKAFCYQKLF